MVYNLVPWGRVNRQSGQVFAIGMVELTIDVYFHGIQSEVPLTKGRLHRHLADGDGRRKPQDAQQDIDSTTELKKQPPREADAVCVEQGRTRLI
jgi:hypothetical protein